MKIQLHVAKSLKRSDDQDEATKESIICQELVGMLRSQLEARGTVTITDNHPDLIHLFGYDDAGTLSLMKRARQLLIPCIITPLSTLQPWADHHHALPFSHKDLKGTKHLTSSLLVIASSQIEEENLLEKYSDISVKLLENPVVTASISSESYASQMLNCYAEIIALHDQNIHQQIQQKIAALGEPDSAICEILRQTEYIAYQHHRGLIGEPQLAELSKALTTLNYDESLMAERLEQLGRTSFFAQLETLMQNKSLLTEGFMPIPAQENKMFKENTATT